MRYLSKSYEETENIGREISKSLAPGSIVLLKGELGAGKTCLARGILAGLGFFDGVCSPTFTIVNEYPSNPPVNHFDLYRISDKAELYGVDFIEYISNNKAINIIEWADIAMDTFLKNYDTINIEIKQNEDEREIFVERNKNFSG